jgi:hypothetical protein
MQIDPTIQKRITHILGWDEDRYSRNVYETGMNFLYLYVPDCCEPIIKEISASTIWWNWWKMHWQSREESYLLTSVSEVRQSTALALYRALHDPQTLVNELHPNGAVLHESYATMMGKLIDENKTPAYA